MDIRRFPGLTVRRLSMLVLALVLSGAAVRSAGADEGVPGAAPRVAMVVDGASVVVVASQRKLYAFVDDYDTNTPLAGGEVRIETPRETLALNEIAPGIYMSGLYLPPAVVTPLTVSVAARGASLRGMADLIVPQMTDAPMPGHTRTYAWFGLAVVLVLALLWLWQHPGAVRRRTTAV
ncbi:hypothetical protein M2352_005043 [Azospirillum fermentarium]|uniref:hypothetical protein n=1 Tax=Azospirillum fermentarium TaxID=1233114 RepID=UPI0022265100|nr:hypothetical protein [Azospirillum fermentarium]MCW2249383.1 hypothetical protein [Azospirillum fermentarium]